MYDIYIFNSDGPSSDDSSYRWTVLPMDRPPMNRPPDEQSADEQSADE